MASKKAQEGMTLPRNGGRLPRVMWQPGFLTSPQFVCGTWALIPFLVVVFFVIVKTHVPSHEHVFFCQGPFGDII